MMDKTAPALIPTAQPPETVERAITLLWVSWLLGWAANFVLATNSEFRADLEQQLAQLQQMSLTFANDVDLGNVVTTTLYSGFSTGLVISAATTFYVLKKTKQGRNWARIFCLIGGAFGGLNLLAMHGFLYSLLTLGSLGLGFYALALLFTSPGAAWFQPSPPPNNW